MTILEEAQAVITDWEDPTVFRPAIYNPEEPRDVRFSRHILDLHKQVNDAFVNYYPMMALDRIREVMEEKGKE